MKEQILQEAFLSQNISEEAKKIVHEILEDLNEGKIRVCEKKPDETWKVNEYIKTAILLYFKIKTQKEFKAGDFNFFDKIPLKKWTGHEKVRVVPQALVRYGSYIAQNTVLMPSYINIGAYVDEGSLIDTWATVGSCVQVGKNVHVSGGVGLGGVLEPVQAQPVIIEDHVFLGSRSIIVEGVRVCESAVIGAGVVLTQSTKILDVTQKQVKEYKAFIPKNSVVIPGQRNKSFPAGNYQVPCVLIIGQRSKQTDKKTSLNNCLREFNVAV
ncbi:MAG: 2,3,4,5-tetrahydropyridine-2,6-dicarboxylate N-succinyltransferase [Bdellovibrionales bacterium]|nr:2,3,4,5-tetrahydropyridine-2,6-dicarboxylate N-succinyltransferase [Bdellovibrionales bacterium]